MTDDAQDKRAAIVKAALILFTQRGFHGTPTAMISREAGVSAGTLFLYFKTKKDLINSIYFEAKERMGQAIYAGYDEGKDLRDKMKRIWGNVIRWGVENPEEFLFLQQFSSSPFITDITQEEVEKNFGSLFDVLSDGKKTGVLKNIDRRLAMEMLFQANAAVVRKIHQNGDTRDMEKIIDRSFDLVWDGVANR
ncbi:MAG TPA: TetR/AcrR family transcriptional regulator [Methanocella sp.]|nr:TetR/AcrR family transcriptional regulator [Methanocella sp.]